MRLPTALMKKLLFLLLHKKTELKNITAKDAI